MVYKGEGVDLVFLLMFPLLIENLTLFLLDFPIYTESQGLYELKGHPTAN